MATPKTAKWQPWKRLSGYPDGTEIIFWVSPDALHRDKEFGTPYDTPAWSTWTEIVDFGHLSPFLGPWQPWKRPSGNPGGTEKKFCSPLMAYNTFWNTRNRFLTKKIKHRDVSYFILHPKIANFARPGCDVGNKWLIFFNIFLIFFLI